MRIIFRFLICVLPILSFTLVSCAQSGDKSLMYRPNAQLVRLNDNAVNVQMRVVGGILPMDSLYKAIQIYEQIIELDPRYKIPYINLIECHIYLKEYNSAIAVCSQWLNQYPTDVNGLLKRGILYEYTGHIDAAKKDYAFILENMENEESFSINKDMTSDEIDEAISKSYTLFLIDKEEAAQRILIKLDNLFPETKRIERAYREVMQNQRKDHIKRMLGDI